MPGYVTSTMGTLSAVASAATATTILAGRTDGARKGAIISNTDTAILYLLLSDAGTVSATNFSVQVAASTGVYEVPFGYQGRITGIWATDNAGFAYVTEFT